ncbi:hypothetical protein PYW07_005198 [Mythimna separata]|uniref:Uncharacterized protein n=1 Tax=Mythimna separata TaxID=271217 RepID=A0AAD8DNT5_MYTSE|nr:hypothetical protein PYW07_005198 [Mythimna separata]
MIQLLIKIQSKIKHFRDCNPETMTSPAITKSPENQKAEKKSPTNSARTPERAPSRVDTTTPAASGSAGAQPQPETFSWLRIFKLADLMMKQGC